MPEEQLKDIQQSEPVVEPAPRADVSVDPAPRTDAMQASARTYPSAEASKDLQRPSIDSMPARWMY